MMKAKRIRILIVSGVILLILLALSLIPRVASVESLPFDTMTWEKCPELYRDYQELCGDADRWCTVMPEVNVEVVTVKNLWSSCAYYFLPCYRAITRTVPQNGDGAWTASVRILSECSDESSLLARLCDPQLREFELRMEPGEHTVQSMVVDMIPDSIAYQVSIVHHTVTIASPVRLKDAQEISIFYHIGTAESAIGYDEVETSVTFEWNYSLYVCGKPIRTYQDATVTRDYIVNA